MMLTSRPVNTHCAVSRAVFRVVVFDSREFYGLSTACKALLCVVFANIVGESECSVYIIPVHRQ